MRDDPSIEQRVNDLESTLGLGRYSYRKYSSLEKENARHRKTIDNLLFVLTLAGPPVVVGSLLLLVIRHMN